MLKADRADLIKGKLVMVPPGKKPPKLGTYDVACHINPTGCFLTGGPHGDCGLTGRKIIVDTYGGRGRHGGGAFSGKDPTKVDRSAAYMCRYIAKNIVAARLASQCEVQLSYAIGYPDPLNIWVNTAGTTAKGVSESTLVDLIRKHFKLTPKGIIEALDLRRPIYRETARHGHFGRELPTFGWEKTDKAVALRGARAMAGACVEARCFRRLRRPRIPAARRRASGGDQDQLAPRIPLITFPEQARCGRWVRSTISRSAGIPNKCIRVAVMSAGITGFSAGAAPERSDAP